MGCGRAGSPPKRHCAGGRCSRRRARSGGRAVGALPPSEVSEERARAGWEDGARCPSAAWAAGEDSAPNPEDSAAEWEVLPRVDWGEGALPPLAGWEEEGDSAVPRRAGSAEEWAAGWEVEGDSAEE